MDCQDATVTPGRAACLLCCALSTAPSRRFPRGGTHVPCVADLEKEPTKLEFASLTLKARRQCSLSLFPPLFYRHTAHARWRNFVTVDAPLPAPSRNKIGLVLAQLLEPLASPLAAGRALPSSSRPARNTAVTASPWPALCAVPPSLFSFVLWSRIAHWLVGFPNCAQVSLEHSSPQCPPLPATGVHGQGATDPHRSRLSLPQVR
jgi:hypothetical protein